MVSGSRLRGGQRFPPDHGGGQDTILQHGEVGKEFQGLEDHAHFSKKLAAFLPVARALAGSRDLQPAHLDSRNTDDHDEPVSSHSAHQSAGRLDLLSRAGVGREPIKNQIPTSKLQ